MTVLVTGGCGYIGAHVVHALHQAGEKVVVVDDLSYGKPTRIEDSRLYGMDIAAPGAGERLAEILDAEGVDSVIHFAARKQVGESVEKPLWYYQQNINGMLNVLIGMRDSGAKKLVFSSSAATYGVPPVDVVPEDVVPMLPINPYGQTKLFGEWMARACEQPFGIRFCALRYFNVAGCGPVELEDPAILNLIPMLFNRLKQGKAPAIFGDDYPTPDGTCHASQADFTMSSTLYCACQPISSLMRFGEPIRCGGSPARRAMTASVNGRPVTFLTSSTIWRTEVPSPVPTLKASYLRSSRSRYLRAAMWASAKSETWRWAGMPSTT